MAERTPADTLTAAADKLDGLLAKGYDQLEATDSGSACVMFGAGTLPALAALLSVHARIAEFAAERGYRTADQTAAALDLANAILGDDR